MDGSSPVTPETRVKRSLISAQPGFNPRRNFDPEAMESLAESIRQQGILQPILLRPRKDGVEGYWIVCGERRFRGAGMAELDEIPAVIRDLTDREAFLAAMHENKYREGISPAEEAMNARRALDACDGDEVQAAKVLGWSRDRLRGRLLLLHALPEVLDAAASNRIALGHAELLATLPEALQQTVFAKVLESNVSVDELRRQLSAFTQDLSAATFDTAACNGCIHNSSTQSELFEFKVGAGRCANRVCWGQKISDHIAETKTALADEFPLVFLDTEKDPALYRPVVADGEHGVGEEQYTQGCKGCGHFGAVICTRPGKEGNAAKSICFNLPCNDEKRAAFADVKSEPAAAEAAGATAPPKDKKATASAKKPGKPTGMSSSPKRVTEIIDEFFRNTAAEASSESARIRKAVELYAMRSLLGDHGSASSVGRKFDSILKLSNEEMDAESAKMVVKLLTDGKSANSRFGETEQWAGAASRLLTDAGTTFNGRFKTTKDFVGAHTKAGIEALLASASFHESLEGSSEDEKQKSMKKLLTGKHDEIVKAVMKSPHDFTQFVPPSVEARVKALRKE